MATDPLDPKSPKSDVVTSRADKNGRAEAGRDDPGAEHHPRHGGGHGGGGGAGGGGGTGGGGASDEGASGTGRTYRLSEWSQPLTSEAEKRPILSFNNKLPKHVVARLLRKAKRINDPIELRALVLPEFLSGPKRQELTRAVRSVISAAGGGAHMRKHRALAEAILYEVLETRYDPGDDDEPIPTSEEVQSFADPLFTSIGPALYQDAIFSVIKSIDERPPRRKIDTLYEVLQRKRVQLGAPDFREKVFVAADDYVREQKFDRLFDSSVENEFKDTTIPRPARQRAVRLLEELGLDPDRADDTDWARVALGIGARKTTSDPMALAGYGFDSAVEPLEAEPLLPDFETEVTTGFNAEVIRECANLYYISEFKILYDVVDAIALRFFEGMNLGLTETAAKLYTYVKRKTQRFAAEDRMKVASAVFDEENFKPLMGRLVENLIAYNRGRHGSDLLHGHNGHGSGAVLFERSAVIRSIENLQRYLSDRGGGIAVFVAREGAAQWLEGKDILESDDLLRYFGGSFKSGMLGVLEEVGNEIYGRRPPIDRIRTLAVHGRRIIRWLADNTNNVSFLTDADLDVLSEHVQNWLAAYRRPDTEPSWLDDDRYYDAESEEEDDEDIGDRAVREALDNAEADTADADILA